MVKSCWTHLISPPNNLGVGDLIVDSNSSSSEIRVLVWVHKGIFSTLIICRVDQPIAVYLHGLEGELNITRIDNTVPFENAGLQTGTFNAMKPLIVEGYMVALLQTLAVP